MLENILNCSNILDGEFWWSLFHDICSSWQMWSKTFDKKNKLVCFYSTFVFFYIFENDFIIIIYFLILFIIWFFRTTFISLISTCVCSSKVLENKKNHLVLRIW